MKAVNVRERLNIKLDGWQAYIQAIDARLGPQHASLARRKLDRIEASKKKLAGALESLERDVNEAVTLAQAVRIRLRRASGHLRKELMARRALGAAAQAEQRDALAAAIAAMEREANAATLCAGHENGRRVTLAIERTIRAILNLEAEIEVEQIQLRDRTPDDNGISSGRKEELMELGERLRSLIEAIAIARRLSEDQAQVFEAEIAAGVRRACQIYAELI